MVPVIHCIAKFGTNILYVVAIIRNVCYFGC